jgi:hypothetical protein
MSTAPIAPDRGPGPAASDAAAAPTESRAHSLPLWLEVGLAVVFGLFYAYDVWEVVESIVQITAIGLTLTAGGWAVMIAALIAPIACFAVVFALGRRYGLLVRVALYVTGLCVSAVLFLSLSVLLGQIGGVVA